MGDDWKKIRQECSFVLASDVTNPLCGENGINLVEVKVLGVQIR